MATLLNDFPTNSRANSPGYDWPTWTKLDPGTGYGPIVQITRGEDYTIEPERMRMAVTNHASRHGLRVRTSVQGPKVIMQFRAREAVAA